MRKTLPLLAVTALAAVGVAVTAGTASAAPVGGGHDISYPQCPTTPPSGQAWGVAGVNGGLATTANPCLTTQLQWAKASTALARNRREQQPREGAAGRRRQGRDHPVRQRRTRPRRLLPLGRRGDG